MRELFKVAENKTFLQELKENRTTITPFLGAGFSSGICPGWGEFLENYANNLENRGNLHPKELGQIETLRAKDRPNRLEALADILVETSGRQVFKEEMKRQLTATVPPAKVNKFHLLHRAFPFLKITTNYDTLIETTVPQGIYVPVARGNQPEEMDRLFTLHHELKCLLKIHGGIDDMNSIVLGARQYRELYGHDERYNPDAALPAFLIRVFTNARVLFIGCSLEQDRTAMILEDLKNMPSHYCLVKRPEDEIEWIEKKRRLSRLGICPIELADHNQIEEILAWLAGKENGFEVTLPRWGVFVGREKELETIGKNLEPGGIQTITGRLYNIDGAGGVGKTALALEAAQKYGNTFRDGVLPLFRADEHTPISFALALAEHLGVKIQESVDNEAALRAVTGLLRNHQCLLILDNAEDWKVLRYMIPLQSSAVIIVTTRNRDIHTRIRNHFNAIRVTEISLEKFDSQETLALFKRMLGEEYREGEEKIYLEIAENLGYLPIALRQAVSLMAYTPHYRANELRDKLKKESKLDVLRRGCAETESDSRAIEAVFDLSAPVLTAELRKTLVLLAVCAPGPVQVDFLKRLDKENPKSLSENLEQLYTYSWCERRERDGERVYELHQLVRELVRRQENPLFLQYREVFVNEVHELFTDEQTHFSIKDMYYFQLEEAFGDMKKGKDNRLKSWLYRLYYFCSYRGYGHFYVNLTDAVEQLFPSDQWALKTAYAHRALIFSSFGKLKEAMENHKREEKIKEELGDRAGLSTCYGNQALILSDWGKLEEAMDLYKKVEVLFEELGDRTGLSKSYCGQALILQRWGQLEEAMALHKKEEALCEELGDRAGLSRCYGNQALNLKARDQLEEAMVLNKKQETLCEDLGDRAGLARTWWNQGLIYAKQGDTQTQIILWKKSIETNKSMGIPTADDEAALQKVIDTNCG